MVRHDAALTEYDRCNLTLYAMLLDAEAQDETWESVGTRLLGLNVKQDAEAAHRCWSSHLARARWMIEHGLALLHMETCRSAD